MRSCIICGKSKFMTIWNAPIRKSAKNFTKKKEKILKCSNCELVFLKKLRKKLENSAVARNIYNRNNSIEEFFKFHKPREEKKLYYLKKYFEPKNKNILESNCGAGIIISILKKYAKSTTGIDDNIYRNFNEKNKHYFYSNLKLIKKKYDLIFSFSELEHKYDPVEFLLELKRILSKNGKILLRVPNYNNIYKYLLGNKFFKYDYRTSHNYYFSKLNLFLLFKKVGLKINKVLGFNEYDFNHLIEYVKIGKRVNIKNYNKYLPKQIDNHLVKKIEENFLSTSLVYILRKR